jgi:ADP-ribosyl-[dinitrogen reductase] hydrolase
MTIGKRIEGCFLGLAVGDALGVPVEFSNRKSLKLNPVIDMRGYGAWHQPPGTWSDDSSLAFCTAESLSNGYNLEEMGKLFMRWKQEGYWGAHHNVFDIGNTTRSAIDRIVRGEHPLYSGDFDEESNGNGSLMRIAPASIYFYQSGNEQLIERMREVSGITHRHFRSVLSCFIFSKIVQRIMDGEAKANAFGKAIKEINEYLRTQEFNPDELDLFKRILDGSLANAEEDSIRSSGYVLHTLEASLWCFMNSDTYQQAVLKAVNLGGDTDTTACVTGALAGLYYGEEEIPSSWKTSIARVADIRSLATKFAAATPQHPV